jgi:hypothetical protein
MKSKDQRLLEEAYGSILNPNSLLNEGMFDGFMSSIRSFTDKHSKALLAVAAGAAIALSSFGVIRGEKEYESIAETVKKANPEDFKRLEEAKKEYDMIRSMHSVRNSSVAGSKNSGGMSVALLVSYKHLEEIVKEMKQKYPSNPE